MANRHRGEVSALLNGERYELCLTLGALAELEEHLGVRDLVQLAARFELGHVSARDLIAIIACGLRGAGHDFTHDDVGRMKVQGGLEGYAKIAGDLFAATFGGDDQIGESQQNPT